eukprot:320447-Chlamydomonas_euryale.AAC.5
MPLLHVAQSARRCAHHLLWAGRGVPKGRQARAHGDSLGGHLARLPLSPTAASTPRRSGDRAAAARRSPVSHKIA